MPQNLFKIILATIQHIYIYIISFEIKIFNNVVNNTYEQIF